MAGQGKNGSNHPIHQLRKTTLQQLDFLPKYYSFVPPASPSSSCSLQPTSYLNPTYNFAESPKIKTTHTIPTTQKT